MFFMRIDNRKKEFKKIAAEKENIYTRRVREGYALLSKQKSLIAKIESQKPRYKYLLSDDSREIFDIVSKSNSSSYNLQYLALILNKPSQIESKRQMNYVAKQLQDGINSIIARMGNGLTELSQLKLGAPNPEKAAEFQALYDKLNQKIKSYERSRSARDYSETELDEEIAALERQQARPLPQLPAMQQDIYDFPEVKRENPLSDLMRSITKDRGPIKVDTGSTAEDFFRRSLDATQQSAQGTSKK